MGYAGYAYINEATTGARHGAKKAKVWPNQSLEWQMAFAPTADDAAHCAVGDTVDRLDLGVAQRRPQMPVLVKQPISVYTQTKEARIHLKEDFARGHALAGDEGLSQEASARQAKHDANECDEDCEGACATEDGADAEVAGEE